MNKAALFRDSNKVTQFYAQKALEEFSSMIKWRSDGNDSVLDCGCGPGNVTFDVLLPKLPVNFQRLVGVDISKEMIDYAKKTYVHPKLSFEPLNLDIEVEKQSLNDMEPFDHITSFFCLMWIKNQKMCIQNFHKLLKPGGDMLLVFLASHAGYDAYKQLSRDNRWAQYMEDVDQVITPYQYSEDPGTEFQNLLKDCCLTECDVRVQDSYYMFKGEDSLRNLYHSVSPFIDRIPVEHQQAHLDDIIEYLVKKNHALDDFYMDRKTCRFDIPYRLIIAYARKPTIVTENIISE